jgi:hypothetical protein
MDLILKGLQIAESAHGLFVDDEKEKMAELQRQKDAREDRRLALQEQREAGVQQRFEATQAAQQERFEKTQAQQKAQAEQTMAFRREQAQFNKEVKENLQKEKVEKESRKQALALGDRVEVPQDLLGQIDALERTIGFELETYDPRTNQAVMSDTGETARVDIGGVSIPGLGRFGLGSDAQSRIAAIFNRTLKDRSGAAVTEPELLRLQTEFGQGLLNTEEQLITALKEYKAASLKELKTIEGRFDPEIVQLLHDNGGFTSIGFGPTAQEAQAELQRRRMQEQSAGMPPAGLRAPGTQAPGLMIPRR